MTEEELIDKVDSDTFWDKCFPYNKFIAELSIREYFKVGFLAGRKTQREKGQSYPDIEADGIVFCGKCGKQK